MNDLGGVSRSTLRERRRFAARRLRGRLLAWRYLLIALVIALVAGLGAWSLEFHGFGGMFDVRNVDIVGANTTITPAMVEKAAQLPVGSPLVSADLGKIRADVLKDSSLQGAVLEADVSREWPSTIKIVITLRTAVAAVSFGDYCQALDPHGMLFLQYPSAGAGCAKPLDSLPLVQAPPAANNSPSVYGQAAGVAAQLPASLRRMVKYIAIASEDGVTLILKGDGNLHIGDGTQVAWGSATSTPLKAQELVALIKANPGAHAYDVSVPSSPTVQP
ncbi:MAG TPA: FtsQ-type POTRA domain-containing protein [Nocardioides sp.]|nr:FtsQ-type POTRA domain-containing protein [Nocardioides sp.]